MKKFLSMAALALVGAMIAACSSSSDEIIDKQPENPTAPKVYTMVIKASKGGDTTTRALREGTNYWGENTVEFNWSGDETFEVLQNNVKIGTATAAYSDDGNTTITASLTTPPSEEDNLFFYLNGAVWDYTGQVGLLTGSNSISVKYDYAMATLFTGNFTVDGDQIKTNANLNFDDSDEPAGQAIVKFTFKDKNNYAIHATKLNIHDSEGKIVKSYNFYNDQVTKGDVTITYDGGNNDIYAALRGVSGSNLTLTARAGDKIYSCSKSGENGVTFEHGNYYEITAKMNKILTNVAGTNPLDILTGKYTAKTAGEAAALAKQCWTVTGGTVYVVYSASASPYNVSYAYTSDGETTATGHASNATELAALSEDGNTAWFVEPAPTLAEALTIAGMTVTVNYNYDNEDNYCTFVSNGDNTFTFLEGGGFAGSDDDHAKALVVENGKLVFKQNYYNPIDRRWEGHGYSLTFYTSNNTYIEWIGSEFRSEDGFGFLPIFISVIVNGEKIAVTKKITVDDLVQKESGLLWEEIIEKNPGLIYADGDGYVRRSSDNALLKVWNQSDDWQEVSIEDDYNSAFSYMFEGD